MTIAGKKDDELVHMVRIYIIENKEETKDWEEEPQEPFPQDCCGQSCRPCVFDIHHEDVVRWAKECAKRIPHGDGFLWLTALDRIESAFHFVSHLLHGRRIPHAISSPRNFTGEITVTSLTHADHLVSHGSDSRWKTITAGMQGSTLYNQFYHDDDCTKNNSVELVFSRSEYRPFELLDIKSLSHDTNLYKFAIFHGKPNLPIGSHLRTR